VKEEALKLARVNLKIEGAKVDDIRPNKSNDMNGTRGRIHEFIWKKRDVENDNSENKASEEKKKKKRYIKTVKIATPNTLALLIH